MKTSEIDNRFGSFRIAKQLLKNEYIYNLLIGNKILLSTVINTKSHLF